MNAIKDQHKYREVISAKSVYTGKRVSICSKYDEDCGMFAYVLFVNHEISSNPTFDYNFVRETYGLHVEQ